MNLEYMLIILMTILFLLALFIFSGIFKNRKRSAENIYKLIADLEKKYIY